MENNYLSVAIEAANTAGQVLRDYYGKTTRNFKADLSVITQADLKADFAINSILTKNFPDHSILSEERDFIKKESEFIWVIDPLDGTSNFSVQNPFFAVSIGLIKENNIILGVIYSPYQDELFFAEKGKGAFLNNKPIRIDKKAALENSFISFANGRDLKFRKEIIDIYSRLKMKNNVIRQVGAASLELSYVASGRFGAFLMPGVNSWDIAAGVIVVEEAGGIVTDFDKKPFSLNSTHILAASSALHSRLIEIITS